MGFCRRCSAVKTTGWAWTGLFLKNEENLYFLKPSNRHICGCLWASYMWLRGQWHSSIVLEKHIGWEIIPSYFILLFVSGTSHISSSSCNWATNAESFGGNPVRYERIWQLVAANNWHLYKRCNLSKWPTSEQSLWLWIKCNMNFEVV